MNKKINHTPSLLKPIRVMPLRKDYAKITSKQEMDIVTTKKRVGYANYILALKNIKSIIKIPLSEIQFMAKAYLSRTGTNSNKGGRPVINTSIDAQRGRQRMREYRQRLRDAHKL